MAGFDYGNARLHVMKSRLLSRRELEALVESGSLKGLITGLAKTAYRKFIESALARLSGMACIVEALREELIRTVGGIGGFYSEEAAGGVAVVLRRYDVHNLKAILRGLSTNAPPGEILPILLPVGELKYDLLAELAQAPNPRAAIDSLASVASPFARPLLELRAEHPGIDIPRLELALERWHYQEALAYLEHTSQVNGVLSSALKLEADLTNLLIALRFPGFPGKRKELREWLESEDLARLFIGRGSLSFELLREAGMQDSLEAAVEMLSGTPYEPYLRVGMGFYARSGRLSDLEKQLHRLRLSWMEAQMTKDPLGIGYVLGYLALKENEVGNIRWIAQGLHQGLGAAAIRAELEWAT
jgi:V/A-type H+-transporting ATPase subunit C